MNLITRWKRRKILPVTIFIFSSVFLFLFFATSNLKYGNIHGSDKVFEALNVQEFPVKNHQRIENYSISVDKTDDVDNADLKQIQTIDEATETEFDVKSIEDNVLPELVNIDNNNNEDDETAKTEFHTFLQEGISNFLDAIGSTLDPYSKKVENVLTKQRAQIELSMQNYSSSNNEFNLSKYTMEKRGTPIRNIIFTTWRSGSTFLGEAITSHPAMWYHYEPLLHFDIVQVRSGQLAKEGLRVIRQLLQCNYTDLNDYINYGKTHWNLHTHNIRLWKHCSVNVRLCVDSAFLSSMCQEFPFQIMKTVRMRLRLAESLLEDKKLDVRIVHLVRDPRGTMQSRLHRDWCPTNPDCYEPERLCSDMVDDYHAAEILREKYPDKIFIVRYEDVSMNPYSGVKRILDFFRLSYHPLVEKFIKTHTVNTVGGVSSTFRDSKTIPFKWIKHYTNVNNMDALKDIQDKCSEAMELWGYQPIDLLDINNNSNNITELIPLLPPPWTEMIISKDEIM